MDNHTPAKTWQSWDPANLVSHIDRASKYHGAELVETNDLDANGNVCNGCTAEGIEVIFDFTLYRTDGKLN